MNFNISRIITFVKENPEKVISWFLLVTFIFLSSYLVISWPKRKASSSLEKVAIEGIHEKPAVKAAVVSVNFEGLLIRKPFTYYNDFMQRNPFSELPGVVGPELKIKTVEDDISPPPKKKDELICRGIVHTSEGAVAFIEGKKTYVVKEGDEIEGWRIIKIDEEKVKLYNGEKKKELILTLKGGSGRMKKAREISPELSPVGE